MEKIYFATKNQEKINTAKAVLDGRYELVVVDVKCPELQADTVEEIARNSSIYASNFTKKSIVKIDSGLFIETLGGFPGPYSEYVERKLDASDIVNLMSGKTNRSARYIDALAYCEYGKEPVVFSTSTEGYIAYEVTGTFGWNFDRIFIPKNHSKTMALYQDSERTAIYSHKHWEMFIEYLETHPKKT